MMMEPIDDAPRSVPKAPLLTSKLALRSGVRGAKDMMEMPKRKKIILK
jgi:hypothetical protein